MTMISKTLLLIYSSLFLPCAFAFQALATPDLFGRRHCHESFSAPPPLTTTPHHYYYYYHHYYKAHLTTTTTQLNALIYGWEDGPDDESSSSSSSKYSVLDTGSTQCTPTGIALAESLSYDQDRVGSLARLAVAFCPPGKGLELDQIEKIDVICVSHDHIDIQAIICEDGGCVSLAVPVRFPHDCESSGEEWMQGCVIRNLDELDVSAQSTLQQKTDQGDASDLASLPVAEYPAWWISPSRDPAMDAECVSMRSILNEQDFQQDIIALAQGSLGRAASEGYIVKAARVAAVGPAGLAFKVRAQYTLDADRPMHVLDVMYPFGGEPLNDVDALRAAVLGAVATAEG